MIRILTGAAVDRALVDHVLATVPAGTRVEIVGSADLPADAARIDTTSSAGQRRSMVAVSDAKHLDVAALLDACHAQRIVQLPAASACLTRFLAGAA